MGDGCTGVAGKDAAHGTAGRSDCAGCSQPDSRKYEDDFTVIDKNFHLNPLTGAILMMAFGASGALAAAPNCWSRNRPRQPRPAQRSVAG